MEGEAGSPITVVSLPAPAGPALRKGRGSCNEPERPAD
jgi:hypothetical protein